MALTILGIVLAYFIGSINVSILISNCFFHQDVRAAGSGNAGATNAARVFGLKFGVVTFLGDFIKTIAAMLLGRLLGGAVGMAAAGASCLVGHCFPVYYRFKGGKGVSAGAAVGLMIDWRVFAIIVLVFVLGALLTKTASASSVLAAVALSIATPLLVPQLPQMLLAFFATALVLVMHRGNIKRLLKGTEPKFHAAKKQK